MILLCAWRRFVEITAVVLDFSWGLLLGGFLPRVYVRTGKARHKRTDLPVPKARVYLPVVHRVVAVYV